MSNDAVYAAGLLNRALDPATQPPEIKEFLGAEYEALCQLVSGKLRVIDIGCGTGRHLLGLQNSLALGLGLDYERGCVAEARRRAPSNVHFVTADATAIPVRSTFDIAICAFNTWGTISDKAGVLREMRRVAPKPGTRLLSVYSPASVRPRREWYRRLGHAVVAETSEYLESEGGFRSEHFTPERLRGLVGECAIAPLTPIAFAITF
jgi:ubiquinone/menaquinone biosynthesis C-methylase UbiE